MNVIAEYHYIRLCQDVQMLSCNVIPLPTPLPEMEEAPGRESYFPKHCPSCGSDELRFYRIEVRDELDEPEKVFPIFHVKCCKCSEEGPLEHFQSPINNLAPRERIIVEASEFEHGGYKCPKCSACLKGKKGKRTIDPNNSDMWEFEIRCWCGDIVVVIND